MSRRPFLHFTRPAKPEGNAPLEHYKAYGEWVESMTLHCPDPHMGALLDMKREEYVRRMMIGTRADLVRDAICKIAIVDHLLDEEMDGAFYLDSFEYACSGLEAYGIELLLPEVSNDLFSQEFEVAFKTVKAYIESGNANVEGGSQLLEW